MAEEQGAVAPLDTTTASIVDMLATLLDKKAKLAGEVEAVESLIKSLTAQVQARMPVEVESMRLAGTAGAVNYKVKVAERFVPAEGQTDEFWNWAWGTGSRQFFSRTLLQSGVEDYLAQNRTLPPHIKTQVTRTPVVSLVK